MYNTKEGRITNSNRTEAKGLIIYQEVLHETMLYANSTENKIGAYDLKSLNRMIKSDVKDSLVHTLLQTAFSLENKVYYFGPPALYKLGCEANEYLIIDEKNNRFVRLTRKEYLEIGLKKRFVFDDLLNILNNSELNVSSENQEDFLSIANGLINNLKSLYDSGCKIWLKTDQADWKVYVYPPEDFINRLKWQTIPEKANGDSTEYLMRRAMKPKFQLSVKNIP